MNKKTIKRLILAAFLIYIFLLSIDLMSTSFKLFGKDFATQLVGLTSNALIALFIGILATSIVQSSSTVTSLAVGLVASDALTIGTAIPIVMGANIGTSITNTIVSLAHVRHRVEFKSAFSAAVVHDIFNFMTVAVLFPLEYYFHFLEKTAVALSTTIFGANTVHFSSPLKMIIQPVSRLFTLLIGDYAWLLLCVAFVLLFVSLGYFSKLIKPLAETEFKEHLNKHIFSRPFRSLGFGLLLTSLVQSSSITTSLVVPLVGVGLLTVEQIFPYTLGANIGTTITAFLAALAIGNLAALTVSISHMLFNVIGTVFFYPIRKYPIALAEYFSEKCYKSRIFSLGYIAVLFFIVPFAVIFIFR